MPMERMTGIRTPPPPINILRILCINSCCTECPTNCDIQAYMCRLKSECVCLCLPVVYYAALGNYICYPISVKLCLLAYDWDRSALTFDGASVPLPSLPFPPSLNQLMKLLLPTDRCTAQITPQYTHIRMPMYLLVC